jgi:Zn-dependent protease/predicted transcriptional regulator
LVEVALLGDRSPEPVVDAAQTLEIHRELVLHPMNVGVDELVVHGLQVSTQLLRQEESLVAGELERDHGQIRCNLRARQWGHGGCYQGGMFRKAIRIGRLFGIDFRIDSSWLLIFALVVWSLTSLFSGWHPDWTTGTRVVVAFVAALFFFGSVVFHELAHSLVARLYGIPVRHITLHMFGGVSNIEREPPTPMAELLIAIVGPISSVLLGIGMLLVASVVSGLTLASGGATPETAAEAMSRMGPTTTLLMWLGPVNIMVGLFNMIPGFPLDGGRILRAILWRLSGDLRVATRRATSVGQLVGWGFMAAGVAMALGYHVPFFGRGLGSGLWLALIGMFLRNAAIQHQAGSLVEEALGGVRVSDLMRTQGPWVSANTSLRELVQNLFVRRDESAFPVFDGERFAGLVTLDAIQRVPSDEWNMTPARQVMLPVESLTAVAPTDSALDALKSMGASNVAQLPVVSDGALIGMLFERDLSRWVELQMLTSTAPPRARPSVTH